MRRVRIASVLTHPVRTAHEIEGLRRNVSKIAKERIRLKRRIATLDQAIMRRNGQIRVDDAYIRRISEHVPPETLAAIKDEMRGHDRREVLHVA